MKNKVHKINIFIIIILALLSSCVGTVKDKDAQLAINNSNGDIAKSISFEGLNKAVATAHNKVELSFFPSDADTADVIYEIYVNNGPIPIKVSGASLTTNALGLYVFTVTNLDMNSTYTFNMRAMLVGTTATLKLDPSKSLSATTFKNETADFMGISSLTLGAGESGRDTLTVKWIPAISRGTFMTPRSTDPVAYEIVYIKASEGARNLNNPAYSGTGRVRILTPGTIPAIPTLNKDKELQIPGLTPGESYFFQVRAIHKEYATYGIDQTYKHEENTRFLKITMLNNSGIFDFNEALVSMSSPLGEPGLTNLSISWIPAAGEFKQYRLCYKKVANPLDPEPVGDFLLDADIDTMLTNANDCLPVDANFTAQTLSSLTSYAYYQAKLIACKTFVCEPNNRIKSILMQKRVLANVAPFNGITSVKNPSDPSNLQDVKLSFNSPVVSTGYMNNLNLYCYSSISDTSPVALPTDGTVSLATGKPTCDGIQMISTMPSSLADFGALTELEIKLPLIDGAARYCLALLPSINSPFLNQENSNTAVIKCFTPEIKTPNIIQFPGRNNSCDIIGRDLNITWPVPTGGIYNKFIVLYKQKTGASNFFNFPDAVQAYLQNNSSSYKWIDNITEEKIDYKLDSLVEGRTYSVGVLPYLENGATKTFGQYNINIGECTLPLPTPSFNEWVDIFAIGPKEDGLTPPGSMGARSYIIETLDADGIPIDMLMSTADKKVPSALEPLANAKLASVNFDGVYGSMDGLEINPLYQYSNSGIIKLAWKDVGFYNDTMTMNTFITNPAYEPSPANKNIRKFGYKVYRSDDNQLSWIDLTKNYSLNKFQTMTNSGLVSPVTFSRYTRNNGPVINDTIASFTDYSVVFAKENEEVDRAKVYYYKIMPVFDGKELIYNSTDNSTHHIIKVTLPPRNMALVHRMMANRTICLEMNKNINKMAGHHYSCAFNGLGSTGLTKPWTQGNTVYDLGGDLLIDRFELSCPFTRGDTNYVNGASSFSQDTMNFKGVSTTNDSFQGCYSNNPGSGLEPRIGGPAATENYVYKKVIPGDCFGAEASPIANGSVCADPATSGSAARNYIYPGSAGQDMRPDCTDPTRVANSAFNYLLPNSLINANNNFFPLQSEFAAVYYSRTAFENASSYHLSPGSLVGGSGKKLTQSSRYYQGSCNVNLSYINNTDHYRPRWISVNSLFERTKSLSADNSVTKELNLYSKKISEILASDDLYDSSNVKAPTGSQVTTNRYKQSSTLARVVTSNSAKLPPLEGLASSDVQNICSTYKVQVGLDIPSRGFIPLDNKIYSKRLMRKKESTVAGAWPQTYNEAKVNSIEDGTYTESGTSMGCNTKTKVSAPGSSQLVKGNFIPTNFPHKEELHPTLMVGSSSRDPNGNNFNSEKCVSRFGVQDLVGNMIEQNSDQVFCDYGEDKLYLGLGTDITTSVPVGVTGTFGTSTAITPFYERDKLTPWVLSTPNSGSCSVVRAGASRPTPHVDPYESPYINSDSSFATIYDYLGNLITSLISKAKSYDQDSILMARNGNGSFLDFGQLSLSPKLSNRNTISMADEDNTGSPTIIPNYFNPALGMPLLCENGCDSGAEDNATISSDQICANKTCNDLTPRPLIMDFPVNNSSFTNLGTGDIRVESIFSSNDPTYVPFSYVSDIILDANPALNDYQVSNLGAPSPAPGIIHATEFSIPRGSALNMYTGGSYKQKAGRYSLNITGSSTLAQRFTGHNYGSRCSIMINEDE